MCARWNAQDVSKLSLNCHHLLLISHTHTSYTIMLTLQIRKQIFIKKGSATINPILGGKNNFCLYIHVCTNDQLYN